MKIDNISRRQGTKGLYHVNIKMTCSGESVALLTELLRFWTQLPEHGIRDLIDATKAREVVKEAQHRACTCGSKHVRTYTHAVQDPHGTDPLCPLHGVIAR